MEIDCGEITSGTAIDIDAAKVEDGKALALDVSGLTTGKGLEVYSDSSSTSAHKVVSITQDNAAATAGTALVVQSDGGATGVFIDKNASGTAAQNAVGLHLDFDRTVAGSGTNAHNDIGINLDVNSASLGTSSVIGMDIDVVGATSGTHTAIGIDLDVDSSDTNIGMQINTAGTHLKLVANADVNDYATIALADTGDLTIATVGSGTTDSDMTLTVDGDIAMTAAGGDISMTTATADSPGAAADLSGAVVSSVSKVNGEIITILQVDLIGLRFTGTAKQIIGEDGESNADLTKLTHEKNGYIYKVEMACVETPTNGGTPEVDIDLVTNTSRLNEGVQFDSTGAGIQVINSDGNFARGRFTDSLATGTLSGGLDDNYVYLAGGAGAAGDADYTAGKFIIKFYGAVVA